MNDLIETQSDLDPSSDLMIETADSGAIFESPTISRLPIDQRPKPSTVCETCPAAIWYVLPRELRCYCRAMHVLVYSDQEKNVLTACDGREMALEQMMAQQAE
ncbi:hypothetical protein GCM10007923_64150 [Shinella yambaruensis]|uniref:Conjugal transfer protein TraH n=1 Tax=Shinella yambaruensis TaxID=415996 RepID=A0ABQ5ZR85_9HYPH|nr:hypothetical protein GCM10007923_64150 [Shinella yambaruensis]